MAGLWGSMKCFWHVRAVFSSPLLLREGAAVCPVSSLRSVAFLILFSVVLQVVSLAGVTFADELDASITSSRAGSIDFEVKIKKVEVGRSYQLPDDFGVGDELDDFLKALEFAYSNEVVEKKNSQANGGEQSHKDKEKQKDKNSKVDVPDKGVTSQFKPIVINGVPALNVANLRHGGIEIWWSAEFAGDRWSLQCAHPGSGTGSSWLIWTEIPGSPVIRNRK